MTHLSVNINKVATLRNARGENIPDVVRFAVDCERFGAQGITVTHPRPDERHITRRDVYDLRKVVTTEFNIEGYPTDDFMRMVIEVAPEQVTLVPDAPPLTSSAGWDVIANSEFLSGIVTRLRQAGIRSSIFVDADSAQVKRGCKNRCGQGRVIHQTLCRQLHAKS